MKKLTTLIIVLVMTAGIAGIVFAQQEYNDSFFAMYTAAKKNKLAKDCRPCHFKTDGSGERNAYGVMYENDGNIDDDFEIIEKEDADGDGYTNIDEIKAGTWPGLFNDIPGAKKYSKCVSFIGTKDSFQKKPVAYCIVNGTLFDMTKQGGACYIKNNKMMAPLRIGIEQLGGTVKYDAKEKRIDIFKSGKLVGKMWIGKRYGEIPPGKQYDLITAPEIKPGTGSTFVPVKGVGVALNADFAWVNRGKIAHFRFK
jgi:hypothetical protein